MGTIRLILAMAVVLAHLVRPIGLPVVPSDVAVQAFFVISGFYMAVILNEKYVGPGAYRLFLVNRILRLYPAYLIILAVTVCTGLFSWLTTGQALRLQCWCDYAGSSDSAGLVFLAISNLILIGQDWAMFMGRTAGGAFQFVSYYGHSDPPVYKFLLVPQAWALGLECMFYLVAPLVVRRSWGQMALLAGLSFALKLCLFEIFQLHFDPWTYRFFPTELASFLLGSCAYRLHQTLRARLPARPSFAIAGWGLLIAATLGFELLPETVVHGYSLRTGGYMFVMTLLLPLIFECSRNWKIDRMTGELSYPLYLGHILVIWIVTETLNTAGMPPGLVAGIVLSISLACAYVLAKWVMLPVERIRQRRFADHRTVPAPAPARP